LPHPESDLGHVSSNTARPGCPAGDAGRRFTRFQRMLAVLLLTVTGAAGAQTGSFEIRNATTRLADGVYYATARIDYSLSEEALEALNSGLALTIQLQIELTRVRRFWPDAGIATLEQGYELSYQPLSQRYVIRNVNSGRQTSFATLFAALNTLGRIVDLPVIDAALLEKGATHRIAIRVVLDQNTLPGPLRVFAFWSEGFRLESEWYEWRLSD